jgi:uroporphyrin-III C-methyltransferase/precorrin-2 dehydrogenase/sirohydrochlorin ferrochelatase/uroporphyrin-III C-methyltransferase
MTMSKPEPGVTSKPATGEGGSVALVGAGPGDPELLTLKALRLLRAAEVVVFDRLVSPEILDIIPAGIDRIFVGKATGHHHLNQDEINALLVELGRSGRRVVRLKGGDPFLFGRGSEEALVLARHGIPFEVVPGIGSAVGCSSYAGIPLTHRGVATGVRFVTGHLREDRTLALDWDGLADPDTTLAIHMGLSTLPQLAAQLMAAGLPGDTPAAAIENGTTPRQRRVIGTLCDLPALTREAGLQTPTMIIVGRVVALAGSLDWFAPQRESAQP